MQEANSRFWNESTYSYVVLLAAGLLLFVVVLTFLASPRLGADASASVINKPVGTTLWKDVLLIQRATWGATLLNGLAMAMITVSVFELLRFGIQCVIYVRLTNKAFDEFFGDGASTHAHKGRIILQSDNIEEMLKTFAPDLSGQLEKVPSNRLYKARTWLNRWDVEAARAVREEFQRRRFSAPELVPIGRKTPYDHDSQAPFEISMGLGFTLETTTVVGEVCQSWLKISSDTDAGDAIRLLAQLIPPSVSRFKKSETDAEGFCTLFPRNWDLNAWLQATGSDASGGAPEVRDYAMIFRHTRLQHDRRQVFFVLAGFTERGTAAAGRYLAANWRPLWRSYVERRARSNSRGDFLTLIEGPSTTDRISEWSEIQNFDAITPELLWHPYHIDCEWTERMSTPKAHKVS